MCAFAEIKAENRFFESIAKFKDLVAVSCFEKTSKSTKNLVFLFRVDESEETFHLLSTLELPVKGVQSGQGDRGKGQSNKIQFFFYNFSFTIFPLYFLYFQFFLYNFSFTIFPLQFLYFQFP